jgi:hypothetical protein
MASITVIEWSVIGFYLALGLWIAALFIANQFRSEENNDDDN